MIYRKAKLVGKSMTRFVDELIRPQLIEENPDTTIYLCSHCFNHVTIINGNRGFCDVCGDIVRVEEK